jgi:hypothetical protein
MSNKLNWDKLKRESKKIFGFSFTPREKLQERNRKIELRNKSVIDKLHNGKCTVCGKQIDRSYLQCYTCYSTKAVKLRIGKDKWVVAVPTPAT